VASPAVSTSETTRFAGIECPAAPAGQKGAAASPKAAPFIFLRSAKTRQQLFSGIFGPVVTGVIVDAAGYDGAFYVAAAMAAARGLWWLVGVPRIEQLVAD